MMPGSICCPGRSALTQPLSNANVVRSKHCSKTDPSASDELPSWLRLRTFLIRAADVAAPNQAGGRSHDHPHTAVDLRFHRQRPSTHSDGPRRRTVLRPLRPRELSPRRRWHVYEARNNFPQPSDVSRHRRARVRALPEGRQLRRRRLLARSTATSATVKPQTAWSLSPKRSVTTLLAPSTAWNQASASQITMHRYAVRAVRSNPLRSDRALTLRHSVAETA